MIRPASVFTALAVLVVTASSALAQMPPGYIPPGVTHGQNVVNYRVNHHGPGWNDRQPIEAFLTQLGKRSWLRLEYLHWDIEDFGKGPIGAPTDLELDTLIDFADTTEFINAANGTVREADFGVAFLPSFNRMDLNDTQGIRGTYGIWFDGGAIEFNVFGSGESQDRFSFTDLVATRASQNIIDPDDPPDLGAGSLITPNIAIPLNGGELLGFDDSYTAATQAQFWGTELNVLSAPSATGSMVQWQWLGGLRYFNYDESFRQSGSYTNGGALGVAGTLQTRSAVTNNTYGPTIGFRTMMDSKYLTLSVTPRVTFALNDYTSRLDYSDVRFTSGSAATTVTSFNTEEIDFTAVTQVSFLAELHVSESITFFGGYDFLWSDRATRAFNQINYGVDEVNDLFVPDFTLSPDPESLLIQGFSFGGTIRF